MSSSEDTGRLKAQAGQGLLQRRKHRVNVLRRHVTHVADAEALASRPRPSAATMLLVVHEHGQEGRVRDALREVAGGHGVGGVPHASSLPWRKKGGMVVWCMQHLASQ